jgi:tetratricopeptide (TPR) repeat protein
MDQADSLYRQGVEHQNAGRLTEASALYQRVLALRPDHAPSLHLLGSIALQLGRPDIAANLIEAACSLDGEAAAFHNDLGEAYRLLGRGEAAKREFLRALALAPQMGSAMNNLAILLHGGGQLETALGLYRRAVELLPDSAEVRMNLGCALLAAGEIDAATRSLEAALALAPGDPALLLNLGNARMAADRPGDAAALYRRALDRDPDYVLAHVNLGRALRESGEPEAALAHYERALALDPGNQAARWNDGACRLLLGDFERGWQGFAHRFRAGATPPHGLAAPEWDGAKLAGRRLLVHAEQGQGDTLQFVRYLFRAERFAGGTVRLLVQPPLRALLRRHGIDAIGPDEPLPAHDLRVALLDLPRLFGTRLATVPADIPYLVPDPPRERDWAARLGPTPGRRVGLVWQGRRDHANDRNRSIPPALLAPLSAATGIAWFSLQKDAPPPPGLAATDLAPLLDDWEDTAAAVAALDLVVTVDTAIAHLAGALGRPVWILLPFAPDWRWLVGREDTPWYPTARLFRQERAGDWDGVIRRVARALS